MNENDEDLSGLHHKFPVKKGKWIPSCDHCGHVPLNNAISNLINKIGCGYKKHPQYKAWVDKGCKF